MNKNSSKTKLSVLTMVQVALITAVICVAGPYAIPIGAIPVSITIFALFLGLYALGWKLGTLACVLYILIGLVGAPVFSGFSGGAQKLAGPTGGYIIGYIFLCIVSGIFIDKFEKKYWLHIIGMIIGVLVCYIFGTAWFIISIPGKTLLAALNACVFPFIPFDGVKIAVAVLVGPSIRKGVRAINRSYINR